MVTLSISFDDSEKDCNNGDHQQDVNDTTYIESDESDKPGYD